MPDWKELADQVLPVLREGAEGLWDGEVDEDFLKETSEEIGRLLARKALGEPVGDEIEIVKETVRQRALQKAIRLKPTAVGILERVVGVVLKAALTFL